MQKSFPVFMEFVHRPYQIGETIAALATPPGEGGIAIVRISGKQAIELASRLFSGPVQTFATHTAHFGYVLDKNKKKIDEALLLVMRSPKSYTGEDTVEIQCHGGAIAARIVLERVLAEGARSALPGEFTFKAFMNGKLDLTQAEAISQLISAKNERAFHLGMTLLEGDLSKRIQEFQRELITIAAIFEAWVDFPDEGLEFLSFEEMLEQLFALTEKMRALYETFEEGKKVNEGIHLCIVGPPNAGKSSLMNALLKSERAIVTPIAGTTRDLLTEDLTLCGLHFRLIDTAGIRETQDHVEKEGIKRAFAAIESADLILLVLDAQKGVQDFELLENLPKEKTIVLWNKVDLPSLQCPPLPFPHVVKISAKERLHLDDLKSKIDELIWKNGPPAKEELLLSSLRHKEALGRALEALLQVQKGLKEGVSAELLAFDLRQSLFELGVIMGTNITEEILSSIFSQFCIGK